MAHSYKKKRRNNNGLIFACSLILVAAIALSVFVIHSAIKSDSGDIGKFPKPEKTSSVESSKPKPVKETFATVVNIGDVMAHSTQITGAKSGDGYDFSAFFKSLSGYFADADLSVANLELTFGGTESGAFTGYPAFNTPDQLADVIKNSGINLLLTANNHSYDTGLFGMKRTVQILRERGLEYFGTRETEAESLFTVKDVNGIKIGMAGYTYETKSLKEGRKYLNGNILAEEASGLISSFSYEKIDEFYTNAQNTVNEMKNGGAEYIVFYMHWGEEYQLSANSWQKTIAQNLADMGVDMIIGGHPHVVQPMELINSEKSGKTTVCVYSLGNAVSNQRRELIQSCSTGHTEDGLMFKYTLKKKGDEVTLHSVDATPTWVNKYKGGGGYQYTICPLESADAGTTVLSLDSATANKAAESYERTKKTIGESLTAIQNHLGCEITFK